MGAGRVEGLERAHHSGLQRDDPARPGQQGHAPAALPVPGDLRGQGVSEVVHAVPHLEEPRALHARGGPHGGPHLLPGVPRAADRLAHEPQEHPQEEAQALRSSLPLPEGPSPPPAPLPPQLPPSAEEGGPSCGWTKKPSAGAHLKSTIIKNPTNAWIPSRPRPRRCPAFLKK